MALNSQGPDLMATSKADDVMSTPVPTKAHTSKESNPVHRSCCSFMLIREVLVWMGSLLKPFECFCNVGKVRKGDLATRTPGRVRSEFQPFTSLISLKSKSFTTKSRSSTLKIGKTATNSHLGLLTTTQPAPNFPPKLLKTAQILKTNCLERKTLLDLARLQKFVEGSVCFRKFWGVLGMILKCLEVWGATVLWTLEINSSAEKSRGTEH